MTLSRMKKPKTSLPEKLTDSVKRTRLVKQSASGDARSRNGLSYFDEYNLRIYSSPKVFKMMNMLFNSVHT